MKFLSGRYSYFFLLLLVFAVSECIVNPLGDFPLNDDWCYGKAVYYSNTEEFTIGNFGAMTLFTHVVWGMLFTKVFGFSFTVLRFSSFVSVLISMFFLEKLIFKITQNRLTGFFTCLVLLFNPLYFNLSNTYMTDVNFNTLLILCSYYAFTFFETKKLSYFILFFVFSILLVLMRQFGILMPACITVACLFIKENRWKWVAGSVIGVVAVFAVLKGYENYLKEVLPENPAYKFSGGIHFFDKEFWKGFAWNFENRYKVLLIQVCMYTSPFAAILAVSLGRRFKPAFLITLVFVNVFFVCWFFSDAKFPFHNIFENMWLGPETFYESLKNPVGHTYSKAFQKVLDTGKYLLTSITFITLSLAVASFLKKRRMPSFNPELIFLVAFLASYTFMIFITESYFDRYFIPLVTITLIALALISKNHAVYFKPAYLILLCFFYVSVFGTKDYLGWNRARWEAYAFLKDNKNISAADVNAGFELNCWNDGQKNWWFDYTQLDSFGYLIQFKQEEGFKLLRAFEFQRYFPYKKDKINIFVKEANE